MKDYMKNQNNEFQRGKIFRQICSHSDGVTGLELAKELSDIEAGQLAALLSKMESDGLISYNAKKELWTGSQ